MRIAIVSFGHVDVVLPLFKHLKSSAVSVDLYLCFSLDMKTESILNFSDKIITTGLTDYEKTGELLGSEIANYLKDISSVRFFIFHNLKLKSFKNFFLSLFLSKKLNNYDIIHFNGSPGLLPLLIFFLRRKNLVFTIHDFKLHSGERARSNFAERMNRYILKSKYPLIIQNKFDYEYLSQKYPQFSNKIEFIPFGILDVYRELAAVTNEVVSSDILFFGRISLYKGVGYLIKAIEYLNSEGIKLKIIIAGHGRIYFDTSRLEELNISLINRYIPNSELISMILGTKVVVCPYTDATQSGVAMAAFALSKPVIASNVGSFAEIIKDGITGFLVEPKNAADLAIKIGTLLKKPELFQNLNENINLMATYGEYSWTQITDKLISFYSSVRSK